MSAAVLPIIGALAETEVAIGIGALLEETLGLTVGGYLYNTGLALAGTKIAEKIEGETSLTATLADYYDSGKAFYRAQELQDPFIFLENQQKKAPKNFAPDKNEKAQLLDNEDINQKTDVLETKKDVFFNYSPQDLLKVVYDISVNRSLTNDNIKVVVDQYKNNAQHMTPLVEIIEKYIGDIDSDIENNPDYKKYENVYNMVSKVTGQLLNVETSYINENGNLYFIDELGNKLGPMKQGKAEDFHLPSVSKDYVYAGPLSINNSAPNDIVDLAFFAHDLDFDTNGYLDYKSDLKLISRLSNLLKLNLVPQDKIQLIRSIITYFATAGLILDKLRGTAGPVDSVEQDIFLDLRPDLNVNDNNVEYINDLKAEFFVELENSKDEIMVTNNVFKSIGTNNIINEIETELENMFIQII